VLYCALVCEASQRVDCHVVSTAPLDVLRASTWMRDGERWARPGFHCGALRRHRQENAGRCETPVCFRVIIASSSSFGEIFSDAECTTGGRVAWRTPHRRGQHCGSGAGSAPSSSLEGAIDAATRSGLFCNKLLCAALACYSESAESQRIPIWRRKRETSRNGH
jgi:hypothetical protein